MIKCRQRRGKCGAGIPVNEHDIRLFFLQNGIQTGQHIRRNHRQSLIGLHDVEIVIGPDVEKSQYLVQHLPVLSGNADNGLEFIFFLLERFYQWRHFNCFGASAEDKHNFLHDVSV